MFPHSLVNPNTRAEIERRLDRVLDAVDNGIGAIEDFVIPTIESARRAYRTNHVRKAIASTRAAVHRSFRHQHAERARLLHLWAHLEDARVAEHATDPHTEPISPAGRVLRMLAEIERFRDRRAHTSRPRFAADLERIGAAHLDTLAYSDAYGAELDAAALALRDELHPVVGCYAANTLHTAYRLGDVNR